MKYVLKNCRLIPELTEGTELTSADLLVEDGKIAELRPAGSDWGEVDTEDMQGKTVLPGLIDLHMHLNFASQLIDQEYNETDRSEFLHSMEYAREFLKQGFTTIRDCGRDGNAVFLRDCVASRRVKGARIIASNQYLSPTASYTVENPKDTGLLLVDDPASAAYAVRRDVCRGADFIKLMATGAVMSFGENPGRLFSTREEIAAIVRMAEHYGTYLAAHCHGKDGILACLDLGVRTVEHCSFIDDECIERFLKADACYPVPTFAITYSMINGLGGPVYDEFVRKAKAVIGPCSVNMKKAADAGVVIGWGTDCDSKTFRENIGLEFRSRHDYGFDNLEMLKEATLNSAKIAGIDDKLGSIKVGKLADFCVVDGKPDEDITVMYQYPSAVYKEGVREF